MSSSLQEIQKELKQAIFTDYLNGMEIDSIKEKYGFKHARTVYYHFPHLTKQNKLQHMANKISRMQTEETNENNTNL